MFIFICTLVLSVFKNIFKWMLGNSLFFSFCSDSAACPDLESDLCSWESFLSNVREEIEKAKVNHKMFYNSVKICMIVIILRRLESY